MSCSSNLSSFPGVFCASHDKLDSRSITNGEKCWSPPGHSEQGSWYSSLGPPLCCIFQREPLALVPLTSLQSYLTLGKIQRIGLNMATPVELIWDPGVKPILFISWFQCLHWEQAVCRCYRVGEARWRPGGTRRTYYSFRSSFVPLQSFILGCSFLLWLLTKLWCNVVLYPAEPLS